jgi:anti-sigma regulatory factor (Ser/Thr protein kinase)
MNPGARDSVHLALLSDPKYLPLIRGVVEQAALLAGFAPSDRDTVLLAVTEAVSNVIRHAYRDRHDQPMELEVTASSGTLQIDLSDRGRFIDPSRIASRPLDDVRPGGLGVHLIRSTMDAVEYKQNAHGGTTLTLVKRATLDRVAEGPHHPHPRSKEHPA